MFQKPRKAFPLVVEAGCDVFVDFVARELGLHLLDLSLEVVLLLGRGHPAVDCTMRRFLVVAGCRGVVGVCSRGEVCCTIGWLFCWTYAADIEPSLSTGPELEFDEGFICPSAQCIATDTESFCRFPSG